MVLQSGSKTVVDQRGRDAAPRFTITEDLHEYKYHAVLVEAVWVPSKLVFDVRDDAKPPRQVDGELHSFLPMGVYGFQRVEDRDKFCRRANAAAEADEHKVCLAVTIQPPATGPVA